MRRYVLLVALLCGSAQAQAQAELEGRSAALVYATTDLKFSPTADLKFAVVDMGGKTQDLQVKETATEIRIALAADVLFDFDKADLKAAAVDSLRKVAEVLNAYKGAIVIEGHTDGKGTDAYNQPLSERRASAVKNWFVKSAGVAAARISAKGYGKTRPVAPNAKPDGSDDPDGRQKNRRVEIVVSKT